jgi:hypothetical protein
MRLLNKLHEAINNSDLFEADSSEFYTFGNSWLPDDYDDDDDKAADYEIELETSNYARVECVEITACVHGEFSKKKDGVPYISIARTVELIRALRTSIDDAIACSKCDAVLLIGEPLTITRGYAKIAGRLGFELIGEDYFQLFVYGGRRPISWFLKLAIKNFNFNYQLSSGTQYDVLLVAALRLELALQRALRKVARK